AVPPPVRTGSFGTTLSCGIMWSRARTATTPSVNPTAVLSLPIVLILRRPTVRRCPRDDTARGRICQVFMGRERRHSIREVGRTPLRQVLEIARLFLAETEPAIGLRAHVARQVVGPLG